MGGMTTLEYPLNTPPGFVRHIVPLATSARHSAWCISWGEAQRQSIYSDPDYRDGYYYELHEEFDGASASGSKEGREGKKFDLTHQPTRGLAAARMAALLTYRSRDSFESRFGRRSGGGKSKVPRGGVRIMGGPETTDPSAPSEAELADPRWMAWREHNDGHRSLSRRGSEPKVPKATAAGAGDEVKVAKVDGVENGPGASVGAVKEETNGLKKGEKKLGTGGETPGHKIFSAQSYLRYQGDKVGPVRQYDCFFPVLLPPFVREVALTNPVYLPV
jgi:homoserine O-acetyltransferase